MPISEQLRQYIREQIDQQAVDAVPIEHRPALLIANGLGYACYITPDGALFTEEFMVDRGWRGQAVALVLGVKNHPILRELMPARCIGASDCARCNVTGWVEIVPEHPMLCPECHGLGWRPFTTSPR